MWGAIAVGVALAYGLAGLWAVATKRRTFDDRLRPLQQRLAIGLMLLAAFLALPVLDFGAISTRDQLARLESGAVKRSEVHRSELQSLMRNSNAVFCLKKQKSARQNKEQ